MAGLSIWHVLIFAIVVILLFGTAKLKNLGKDVGGAVKDFKKSIRELTTAEIEQQVKSLKEELFNLRFQLATGQLENTARIREVRKAIARMKTVIRQRVIDNR